jgi:hypothetical protein
MDLAATFSARAALRAGDWSFFMTGSFPEISAGSYALPDQCFFLLVRNGTGSLREGHHPKV